uniref:substrate-binding domain-containing protein n=1 Tax=Clostridium sp. NkU-1 TaxID=1095009 RepID=UPI000A8496BD
MPGPFVHCLSGRLRPQFPDSAGRFSCGRGVGGVLPHPLEFINPIVSEFEEQTGIKVEVCTGGTGELLKMAEDRKEPECDIFWGGSLSTTMAQSELFEPYISKNESMIQEDYRNKEGNMTRFTDVPSILMVNTNLAGDLSIEGYGDLLKPELSGKIAMCDPVTSSSAFEHLINMLYAMGEGEPEEGWDYVEAFCKNLDGKLLQSSSEVYQGVAEGRYTVGLTFEEGAAITLLPDIRPCGVYGGRRHIQTGCGMHHQGVRPYVGG